MSPASYKRIYTKWFYFYRFQNLAELTNIVYGCIGNDYHKSQASDSQVRKNMIVKVSMRDYFSLSWNVLFFKFGRDSMDVCFIIIF